MAQGAQVELDCVEVLGFWPEAHSRAGVALADAADDFQRRGAITVRELHVVFAAFALDEDVDAGRQRVDHADADAVQTARKGVVLAAELTASMKAGEDQFDAGDAFIWMDIDRHAATIVGYFATTIGKQRDINATRMSGQRLVDRVVDDLLRQMVGA